jgi:hypothetical protein
MNPTTHEQQGGRIPKALQAVFLASNRGNDVHKPPPKKVAFKVFFSSFYNKSDNMVDDDATTTSTRKKIVKRTKSDLMKNVFGRKAPSRSKSESSSTVSSNPSTMTEIMVRFKLETSVSWNFQNVLTQMFHFMLFFWLASHYSARDNTSGSTVSARLFR